MHDAMRSWYFPRNVATEVEMGIALMLTSSTNAAAAAAAADADTLGAGFLLLDRGGAAAAVPTGGAAGRGDAAVDLKGNVALQCGHTRVGDPTTPLHSWHSLRPLPSGVPG